MTTKPPAPAAPAAPAAPTQNGNRVVQPKHDIPPALTLEVDSGVRTGEDRIVLYGTGGIGKTTAAQYLPAPYFIDIERSSKRINVARATFTDGSGIRRAPQTFDELRGVLASIEVSPPEWMRSVVVDSATVAEQLAVEHVVEKRRTEKGNYVQGIEDFGWGKGWSHVYDYMNALLADLDRIADKGYNVCLIAHDVSREVPNPYGEDFLRWEPQLHSGDKRGRFDIRSAVKNWADHLVYLAYDVHATKDGKGQGSGTRRFYTQELPTHMAKSRTEPFDMEFSRADPAALWGRLGIQ